MFYNPFVMGGAEITSRARKEVQTRQYKPHELAALTFDSFHLSQGDVYIQPDIIRYVVLRERPRISPQVLAAAFPIAQRGTERFIQKENLHVIKDEPKGTRPEDHTKQMGFVKEMWMDALTDSESIDTWLTMQRITNGIAAGDYKFIVVNGGRERKQKEEADLNNSIHTRTHISHLVYYGLLGNTTGHPIYDEMFRDVVHQIPLTWSTYVFSEDKKSKTGEAKVGVFGDIVRQAAQVHFDHYPDEYEQLSPEWKNQLGTTPQPIR